MHKGVNGTQDGGRLSGGPPQGKVGALQTEQGTFPVPAGVNPQRVVSKALGATVPWLFGIALFTYIDR